MKAATQTVLIVDDDPDFLDALSSFLEANRYRVIKARSGAEGVFRARLERPDLVIMDVVMGERTEGFFAVQELRRTPGMEEAPIFADVITPMAFNAASIEDHLRRTAEQSPEKDTATLTRRLEMIVRAYDPCISCSVHVLEAPHAP